MTGEELTNIQNMVHELSINTIKRINDIIESELKLVAEEFNISPDRLVLQVYPLKDNIQKFEVLIKMSSFTISNILEIRGEK